MSSKERIVEELLRKPDPQGYYVIPVSLERQGPNAVETVVRVVTAVAGEKWRSRCQVEVVGDVAIVRVKGRGLARKVAERLLSRGFSFSS